ncbi:hypothetical protein LOTGIDRAFT_235897 [Lottia gigantea]|uniref:Uncharacterized protein n=1 Tax=Lottia gigantea TaxID=225164 RepID=V3ZLP3_LOTGI|nr:hypothetical protein LOTGIDRAFT_235897 [Lottia gigantea]ESO85222.1 hypothetical protein LOTGIDRAFT_235897 [Lottia gigantea]
MADAKSTLTRDGTMQVTAKEGIELLKSEGATKLLKAQGLISDAGDSSSKPSLERDGTMVVTAKEGEAVLDSMGGAPDPDAATRSQQKELEALKNEVAAEPPVKKPKLPKDGTMVATAKEGKALVGSEKLGDTRQETKKKADKPQPKRDSTIAKAVQEAKVLFPDTEINVNEGRRTRSGNKPTPAPAKTPVKRAGTMQKTAKEGRAFLKRKSEENKEAEDGEKDDKSA